MKLTTRQQQGFSLIEVLVSLSIFAVVVTISVGSLLMLINANAKTQQIQVLINNVSAALDGMVRDIRTGDAYQCANVSSLDFVTANATPQDCPNGAASFAFTESGGSLTGPTGSHRIGYRFEVDNDGIGRIERKIESGNWMPITPASVNISELDFVLTNAEPLLGNEQSPVVTVYVAGFILGVDGGESSFSLQTTITQNALDI